MPSATLKERYWEYFTRLKENTCNFTSTNFATNLTVDTLVKRSLTIGKVVGAAELLFGVSDFLIRLHRNDIYEMEGGEEFLRVWDATTAIVGIYGLTRLVIASPKILRNLGEAWKNFKGKQQLKKQNKELYEQMQKEVNAYENQLKNYYDDVNKNQGFAEQATPDGMVKQNTQKPKLEKLDETVETADDLKRTDVDKSQKSGKFEESSLDNISAAGDLLTKLDNAIFSVLKGKVNELDNVLKPQFLEDFANSSDEVLKKLQNDNLFDVWKNDIRSSNIDNLISFKSKGSLRNDYIVAVNSIADKAAELKALGKTDLEIAQEVFNLRRQTTINFKGATPDDMLDIIFEFNDIRYTQTGLGDKWGLSWNGAVTKATKNGVTDYSKIITTASKALGDKQDLGKALFDVVGSKALPVLQKYRMTSLIN